MANLLRHLNIQAKPFEEIERVVGTAAAAAGVPEGALSKKQEFTFVPSMIRILALIRSFYSTSSDKLMTLETADQDPT